MTERRPPAGGAVAGRGDRSTASLAERLRADVSGEVLADEPLAAHTTIKVGGPAAALVRAEGPDDLAAVAAACAALEAPWFVLGRGSNLLVADEGWPGAAVVLGRGFRGVEIDGPLLVGGAAELMPSLAARAAAAGLGGLAFGVAIPGTLGGAVRMNAGAHGREMADVLDWVEVARLARGATVERLAPDDLGAGYRRTALPPDAVVVRAGLRLEVMDADTLRADMAEMKGWRRAHQPIGVPSCGSVFANPEADSAGRLVEAAGMKGFRRGSAQVSEVHANFITVDPPGRAADVYAVIRAVEDAVRRTHGVTLRREVVLAGFDEAGPEGAP